MSIYVNVKFSGFLAKSNKSCRVKSSGSGALVRGRFRVPGNYLSLPPRSRRRISVAHHAVAAAAAVPACGGGPARGPQHGGAAGGGAVRLGAAAG